MRFTPQIAREMAAKGHEARRRNIAERKALFAPHFVIPGLNDSYVTERLACVRAQLGRLDAMVLTETDPQKLDRLASAQAKLADQERILSGRPLPGSRRPKPEREPKAQPTVLEPQIPSEPQPVGQDTPTN